MLQQRRTLKLWKGFKLVGGLFRVSLGIYGSSDLDLMLCGAYLRVFGLILTAD